MAGRIPVPLQERIESKYIPEPNCGCWLWIGGVNEHNYGIIGLGSREQGVAKAHRVMWEIHHGPIPDGLNVLHRCDMPQCVNPEHLFLGTKKDNSVDMVRKGRCRMPDNRGERAAWAKLTAAAIHDIRTRRMTARRFSRLYRCSASAIHRVWEGKNWKSV